MAGVAYYRVSDPLENFKLRVTVREIPRVDPTGDDKSALTKPIEVDLSWQEKILGPRFAFLIHCVRSQRVISPVLLLLLTVKWYRI
jgi:hypothetical protein